ncbi:HET domain-containing protein [Microdochium nivale]|nr:HET domain-containing protein [Microdochium nivale]
MDLCARCQAIDFKPFHSLSTGPTPAAAPPREHHPQGRDGFTGPASPRNSIPTSALSATSETHWSNPLTPTRQFPSFHTGSDPIDESASQQQQLQQLLRRPLRRSDGASPRPAPTPVVVHVLHETRDSFNSSLASKCRLCLLINSQLTREELVPTSASFPAAGAANERGQTDSQDILGNNFMVLKRPWPAFQGSSFPQNSRVTNGMSQGEEERHFEDLAATATVMVLSRRGPAVLKVVQDLPDEYCAVYHRPDELSGRNCAKRSKKRKFQDFASNRSTNLPKSLEAHTENTGSLAHMKLAGLWLRNCLDNHELCNIGSSSGHHRLPRRLVDVSDPQRPLLVNVAALPRRQRRAARYVALSYCWGDGERVMTLKSNYESHLHGIPLGNLPKTFVDAFKVARELSFQYIWTDAFCMIQDSPEDKRDELPKMGDIYRYAAFTICAEGSPNSHAGLFHRRKDRSLKPCKINLTTSQTDGIVSAKVTLATKCVRVDYLEPRGWILQEEILACRRLLFGTQVTWRCISSDASEVCPVPVTKTRMAGALEGRTEDKLRVWLYEGKEALKSAMMKGSYANHFDAWRSILEVYSLKELSFVSDVLAAVEGLANIFAEAHGTKYLAGIWQEDLQLGLSWYVSNNERRNVEPLSDQWPSWSWASVGKVAIRFRKWPRLAVRLEELGAKLVSTTCEASAVSPVAGTLVLRVRAMTAFVLAPAEGTSIREPHQRGSSSREERQVSAQMPAEYRRARFQMELYEDEPCQMSIGTAALDRPLDNITLGTTAVRSILLALLHAQRSDDGLHAVYLILEKKHGDSRHYIRRGVAFLDRLLDGMTAETIEVA